MPVFAAVIFGVLKASGRDNRPAARTQRILAWRVPTAHLRHAEGCMSRSMGGQAMRTFRHAWRPFGMPKVSINTSSPFGMPKV
jgi:hypothetical protein